jgi:hypothetical protein
MAPAVLTRLESYKFQIHHDTAVVVALLMRETGLLAAKLGIPLEDREPLPIKTLCSVPLSEAVTTIRHFGTVMEARAPAHKVSALQDLEQGRRLEVEETLGYAVRKGAGRFPQWRPVIGSSRASTSPSGEPNRRLWEGVRGRRCGRHRRRRPEARGPGARGGARRAIARRREGVPSGT